MAATDKFIGIGLAAGAGYLLWSKLRPKTAEAAAQAVYEKSVREGDAPAEAEAKAEAAAEVVEAAQEPPAVPPAAEEGPSISESTPFETWTKQHQEASKAIAKKTGATHIGIDSWAAFEKMPFDTKRAINLGREGQKKVSVGPAILGKNRPIFTKKQIFRYFQKEMSKFRSKARHGRVAGKQQAAYLTSQYGHLRPPNSGSPRSFTNWYVIHKKKSDSIRRAYGQCGPNEDVMFKLDDPTLKLAFGGMHRLGWVATSNMGSGYNFKNVPEGGFAVLQKVFDAVANRQYVMKCYEA
jgi:hypothetical protein